MDWYLNGNDPEVVGVLRREVMDYLQRHAEGTDHLDDAELILSEVLGNSVRHAGGPIWVSLSWRERSPHLVVRDLGPGFDPHRLLDVADAALEVPDPVGTLRDENEPSATSQVGTDVAVLAEGGRGLFLISHLAPTLQASLRPGDGMSVSVTLPVTRPIAANHDPPRNTSTALPALSEVRPEGAFGRESFLRALVVQLAQTVEFQHGPDAADVAVAQVGTDVGGQMEAEFRIAERIVAKMTPEQLAHCYVRLKHAIDGGFYVIEANSERIVLGNTRCPFGGAVRLAPSLCQMTSSVFGGIAARNSDRGASVLLEERIAQGDPGCRVVVYLTEPPADERPFTQHYAPPEP